MSREERQRIARDNSILSLLHNGSRPRWLARQRDPMVRLSRRWRRRRGRQEFAQRGARRLGQMRRDERTRTGRGKEGRGWDDVWRIGGLHGPLYANVGRPACKYPAPPIDGQGDTSPPASDLNCVELSCSDKSCSQNTISQICTSLHAPTPRHHHLRSMSQLNAPVMTPHRRASRTSSRSLRLSRSLNFSKHNVFPSNSTGHTAPFEPSTPSKVGKKLRKAISTMWADVAASLYQSNNHTATVTDRESCASTISSSVVWFARPSLNAGSVSSSALLDDDPFASRQPVRVLSPQSEHSTDVQCNAEKVSLSFVYLR